MPIPTPSTSEKIDEKGRQKFISRCMTALKDENKPQEQKLAICFSAYKNAKKKKETQGSLEEPDWDSEHEVGIFTIMP